MGLFTHSALELVSSSIDSSAFSSRHPTPMPSTLYFLTERPHIFIDQPFFGRSGACAAYLCLCTFTSAFFKPWWRFGSNSGVLTVPRYPQGKVSNVRIQSDLLKLWYYGYAFHCGAPLSNSPLFAYDRKSLFDFMPHMKQAEMHSLVAHLVFVGWGVCGAWIASWPLGNWRLRSWLWLPIQVIHKNRKWVGFFVLLVFWSDPIKNAFMNAFIFLHLICEDNQLILRMGTSHRCKGVVWPMPSSCWEKALHGWPCSPDKISHFSS